MAALTDKPVAPGTSFASPERQRLVLIIESSLHFLARSEDMTRDEAANLKQRVLMAVGLLNKRFSLRQNPDVQKAVDNARSPALR